MTRTEIHQLIDQLPEGELHILMRLIEGLQATRATDTLSRPVSPPSPIRPVNKPIRIRHPSPAPLTKQYNEMMAKDESLDHSNLLRKVMFTRVSDLMNWVNQANKNTVQQK